VSPETAVAIALTGEFTDPRSLGIDYPEIQDVERFLINDNMFIAPPADGSKCRRCNGSGFKGRTGIFELLFMNDELRSAVNKNASSSELEAIAVRHGMITLQQDADAKVAAGITTEEEVRRSTAEL